MLPTYCGNNALCPDLLNGNKQLGTRYQCFRKGLGKGLNLPIDPNYNGAYNPIDPSRVYCGNQNVLPAGYNRMVLVLENDNEHKMQAVAVEAAVLVQSTKHL